MGTSPYIPAPTLGRVLREGHYRKDIFLPPPSSQQLAERVHNDIPQARAVHQHLAAATTMLENIFEARAGISGAALLADLYLKSPSIYDGYINDFQSVLNALQNVHVQPGSQTALTGVQYPALNALLADFFPSQTMVLPEGQRPPAMTPQAVELIKSGTECLAQLHTVLQKIHVMPQTLDWVQTVVSQGQNNEKPHPMTRGELIVQFDNIIAKLNRRLTNCKSPAEKLTELQRARVAAWQLLSADGLQRLLQAQLSQVLLNVTAYMLTRGNNNPCIPILQKHREEYEQYLGRAEYRPFMATIEHTRQWFCEYDELQKQASIDALLEVAAEKFPLPLTHNINPADRHLETMKLYQHRWVRAVYRAYLNDALEKENGSLHPHKLMERAARNIINGQSFLLIDQMRANDVYTRLPELLESLGIQVDKLKQNCILQEQEDGKFRWAPNALNDLSAHLLLAAVAERCISASMLIGINRQGQFVFRGYEMDGPSGRGALRHCEAGRIMIRSLALEDDQPKETPFAYKDAPENSQRQISAFLTEVAELSQRQKSQADASRILQFLKKMDDDVSRTAVAGYYFGQNSLISPLRESLESQFLSPSYHSDPDLQQTWNLLTRPENQYLLRGVLRGFSITNWNALAIAKLFDQVLYDPNQNPNRSPVKQLLINVLKDRKGPDPLHYPRFVTDVDALLNSRNVSLLKELLDLKLLNPDIGANEISRKHISDKSLLIYAVKHGSPEAVWTLCDRGVLARDTRWFASDSAASQETALKDAFKKHGKQFGNSDFVRQCITRWTEMAPVKIAQDAAEVERQKIQYQKAREEARLRELDREPLI